jgi:hypothetical protein
MDKIYQPEIVLKSNQIVDLLVDINFLKRMILKKQNLH